jgi:ribonucrease Y
MAVAFAIALLLGVVLGILAGRVRSGGGSRAPRAEADQLLADARREAARLAQEADLRGREEAGALRDEAAQAAARLCRDLDRVRQRLVKRQNALAQRQETLAAQRADLDARRRATAERDATARASRDEVRALERQWQAGLELAAGTPAAAVRREQKEALLEEVRADAAVRLREEEAAFAQTAGAEAQRVMAIACERYSGHYLTERSMWTVQLPPADADRVKGPEGAHLAAIQAVTGTTLTPSDAGDAFRIEAPDGVAREGARRAMIRFAKQTRPVAEPVKLVQQVVGDLEREIDSLGRKAFEQLKLPRAHAEIVRLVGRLNWRTSYTQNQWKHAVEAAQLAGLVAAELGLDGNLARRGALLHDIGKSLTPAVEGSHAVIGAEIARRLGEAEIVANSIGAHHAEEPCNTPYAHLVAGTDAMSGGRPGARREATMVEAFGRRVEDMERIASGFRGVERVFALQGGREVRVYVRETDVDDGGVARLSSEIARKISDDVVFPGQVKVTVIREHRAVAVAR